VYTLKQEWVAPELIAVVDSIREAADVASAAAASTTGRVAAAARELRARLKQRPPGVFTCAHPPALCSTVRHPHTCSMPEDVNGVAPRGSSSGGCVGLIQMANRSIFHRTRSI
jgi:hypothetical protein